MFRKQIPLFALCLGFFMVIIDVTIVNVALPSMEKDLNVGISALQWIVAGYTLTFACLLLSAGNLGDQFGAKTAFIIGLILFALTSLGCGIVSHLGALTALRLLQGVSAAFIVPTSLALINASYQNKKDRAKAIGVWATLGSIAAATGPLLGAVLTTWFGWRAVFLVNVPIGIVAVLLTIKYVRNPNTSQKQINFDIWGQLAAVISIAVLAFSLIEAGNQGWLSQTVMIGLCIFALIFTVFLVVEYRTVAPMLPLTFFKSTTFSAAIAVGMLLNIGGYGILFILPLYFQQMRGYSVLMTGLAIVPMFAFMSFSSYFAGRWISIAGSKMPIVMGLMIAAIGSFILMITKEHAPSYWALVLPLIAVGVGTAFTMPAATIAAMHSVPEDRAGIASGAFSASRQIGSLLGVATFGSIINASDHFISGMHICLIIATAVFLCGCLAAFVCVDKKD